MDRYPITVYKCAVCLAEHTSFEAAKNCASVHIYPAKILSVTSFDPDDNIPDALQIEMSDGSIWRFEATVMVGSPKVIEETSEIVEDPEA